MLLTTCRAREGIQKVGKLSMEQIAGGGCIDVHKCGTAEPLAPEPVFEP